MILIRHRDKGRPDALGPVAAWRSRMKRDPELRRPRGGGEGRIRCPHCGWEPQRGDHWACSCGHVWNTFETGGVCPGCERRWEETQCLRCQGWSAHRAWYQGGEERAR